MKKILLINNMISPVCIDICKNIWYNSDESGVTFKALFLSTSDKNRHWENLEVPFDYEVLDNIAIRFQEKDLYTFFINTGIIKKLNKEQPDKIICFGWDHFAAYAANWWARKNNNEFVLWSGSTSFEKSWRRTLFRPLVKYLVGRSDLFVAYGTKARDYLVSLAADFDRVIIHYHNINTEDFKQRVANFTSVERKALREKLGIMSNKVILYSGQLIERKGVYELLKGFKHYQEGNDDISLLVIGRGLEKGRMLEMIGAKNIKNVFFADFVQYEDVHKYYAISDLLILPSREEVWGLVINEALACGLPVITTEETGAGPDLIQEGRNGYIIKSNCPECIAKAISKVFENMLDKKNNSYQIIDVINRHNDLSIERILDFPL